jgi:hypothetical protein
VAGKNLGNLSEHSVVRAVECQEVNTAPCRETKA